CSIPPPANQTLHKLINEQPIERLIITTPRINKATTYRMVLLVISGEYETKERNEIRTLWASVYSELQKSGESRVIFVVGRSQLINKEATSHGDILQIDIEETYRNMVYKIESSFRWLEENIETDFIAKIDSDTVVHIDRLYYHLKLYEQNNSGDWIACFISPHAAPIRDKCSSWLANKTRHILKLKVNIIGTFMKMTTRLIHFHITVMVLHM
ncbi:hypothetical protein PFISCL1PPCAC_3512, partial [Pristionchus fissidentatus]